jgi:hypothetical protein
MAEDEPRCVHYQFAHVALRTLVFEERRLAPALWHSDDPASILDDIAVQVDRACRRMSGEGGNLRAEQLRVSKREIGQHPCVVVEMPQPIATTEAFMVAIVLLETPELDADEVDEDDDEGDEEADAARDSRCRYFTLEYSALRSEPHTVLAEWTAQGSHMNLGGGPPPSIDAFAGELAKLLLD